MLQHGDSVIKIFVSATSCDLGKHRAEVADALARAGVLPVEQTKFPPLQGAVRKELRRLLDGCAGAICLVGAWFGSHPNDAGRTPRSYSQIEYDYITELGIPVYIFMTPDAALDASTEDPALKALQCYHRECIKKSDDAWEEIKSVPALRERVILAAEEMKKSAEAISTIPGFRVSCRIGIDGPEELLAAVSAPGTPEEQEVVLRVLAADATNEVRSWFVERGLGWRELDHPSVVASLGESEYGLRCKRPYLVTEALEGWATVLDILRRDSQLADLTAKTILRQVVSVFELAASRGLKILGVSLGDLYVRGEFAKLGGLHTCSRRDRRLFRDRFGWSKVTTEWGHMAPELNRPDADFDESADVYGLGGLLERLRGRAVTPTARLERAEKRDPLRCLAFHCLAEDPAVRFQSVRQVGLFLAERTDTSSLEPPSVDIDSAETKPDKRIRMAKYPVTNAEYELFCEATQYPLPRHLSEERGQPDRLSGPWLPVVGVSLSDAEEYSRWLSRSTGVSWRVPTAAEWRSAALGHPAHRQSGATPIFPWGDEPPDCQSVGPLRANYLDHFGGTTVVGSFWDGTDEQRCLDLGGNVWEWTVDKDPGTHRRIVLGGAYDYDEESMKLVSYKAVASAVRDAHIGFRVVTGGIR